MEAAEDCVMSSRRLFSRFALPRLHSALFAASGWFVWQQCVMLPACRRDKMPVADKTCVMFVLCCLGDEVGWDGGCHVVTATSVTWVDISR